MQFVTREIKSRIGFAKAAFNKKTLFASRLDLNLSKKLVTFFIWVIALFGAESWTLRKVDWKYLESFEMWCWEGMDKISWTDHVRNEISQTVKEERITLQTIKRRKANWNDHILRRNCFLKHVIYEKIEGRIDVTGRRGWWSKTLLDDLEKRGILKIERGRTR